MNSTLPHAPRIFLTPFCILLSLGLIGHNQNGREDTLATDQEEPSIETLCNF